MKLMIAIIIALTIFHVPLLGDTVRNILAIIVLFKLVFMIPGAIMGVLRPRRVM